MAFPLVKSSVGQIKKDLMVRDIFPVKNCVGGKCDRTALISPAQLPSSPELCYFPPFRMLDCGAHRCQQVCHRGPCQQCPRSPSLLKTCPCGQTPLTKLLELGYSERRVCSDPIPSCGKTCSKPLACGSSGEEAAVAVCIE